jgi:hypothetical protein
MHPKWFFDFLRTRIINPKNHPYNCWSLFLFITTTQHTISTRWVDIHVNIAQFLVDITSSYFKHVFDNQIIFIF